jgi:hypothetical protein
MWWLIWIYFLQSCLALDRIFVHMVPHTHDDMGWLKTADQYYYGSRSEITFAGVQYILDSVTAELQKDPARKFTLVEMGFFDKWWGEQDTKTQGIVRNLVKTGQLQFVNGGWVMHDEATPYHEDMIDNMVLGHELLKREFDYVPRVAWHIDPFGHSAANADLFAKMGFDALFFARIDYQDREKRRREKSMEMVWRPYIATGEPREIFTHAMYSHYSAPDGFCFDIRCDFEPIIDDPLLQDYNIESRAQNFIDAVIERLRVYRSNHVLITMGDDFNYQAAGVNFKNMDKLINYINSNNYLNMTLFYSTPNDYIDAVHTEGLTFPVKTDDFFPYADGPHAYWTGYFTSRPALKKFVRTSGSYLRAAQSYFSHLYLSRRVSEDIVNKTVSLFNVHRKQMGLLQHHDGVSGTERQHVTNDYEKLLTIGENHTSEVLLNIISLEEDNPQFFRCPLYNETVCEITSNSTNEVMTLAVLNSNFRPVRRVVSVPVSNPRKVINQDNIEIPSDIVLNFYTPTIPNSNNFTLYFIAEVPAISISYYKLVLSRNQPVLTYYNTSSATISNNHYQLSASLSEPWRLTRYSNVSYPYYFSSFFKRRDEESTTTFNVSLGKYLSSGGDMLSDQRSGAYIFRPALNSISPYAVPRNLYLLQGKVIHSVLVQYSESKAVQAFNLYQGAENDSIEVDTWLNSILPENGIGEEVCVVFKTNIDSGKVFYTDSNGMNMMRREWNYRPTWNVSYENEPISSNYYPVNSAIYIQDSNTGVRFTVLNDRSQGGTAYSTGNSTAIELMINRRTYVDDGRGVDEPIDERDPYSPDRGLKLRLTHHLLYGNTDLEQRLVSDELEYPLLWFLSSTDSSFSSASLPTPPFSVPSNIRIRFRPVDSHSLILRVQNLHSDEPFFFDIAGFLSSYNLEDFSITEVGLSENQSFSSLSSSFRSWSCESPSPRPGFWNSYTFNSSQWRAFLIKLSN